MIHVPVRRVIPNLADISAAARAATRGIAPIHQRRPGTGLALKNVMTRRTMAPLMLLMLAMALTTGSAQVRFGDTDAIVRFQRAADNYAFLHRQVERRLGMIHHAPPGSDAMAIAMREARPGAMMGELLTADVVPVIRLVLTRAARAADCGLPPLGGRSAQVHDLAHDTDPLPPCLLDALPRLPVELEFRWSGDALVLVDTHAGLVVDLISGLLGTTVLEELEHHR